ncbi:MAG TPA: hypothetical protein ENJ82_07290, partial [Bacteroidetes bacterium]|nr:hypothetical protein [Bacteroidota bacterium]
MEKKYLWLFLLVIGMGTTACGSTTIKGGSDKMENVKTKMVDSAVNNVNAEIVNVLEGLFKWYIGRAEGIRISTGYNAEELAIIENKAAFLAALRSSAYVSAGFVDRLERQY